MMYYGSETHTYAAYGNPVAAVASGAGCLKAAAAAAAAAAVYAPRARPRVNATPLNAAAVKKSPSQIAEHQQGGYYHVYIYIKFTKSQVSCILFIKLHNNHQQKID